MEKEMILTDVYQYLSDVADSLKESMHRLENLDIQNERTIRLIQALSDFYEMSADMVFDCNVEVAR